jgi:hypothetical protein
LKQREDKRVSFEISVNEGNESEDPRPEDLEYFKDVKVIFSYARYNLEMENIGK